MPSSALGPVSVGLFTLLNVASLKGAYPGTGAGCVGGVKDYVPQAPVYPFLFFEVSERDLSSLGDGPSVKRIQVRLHVFSQYLGAAEAQRITAEAIRLVQFAEPTATGWTIPKVGRPDDVVMIELSELNGVICRELVTIWEDFFACEVAA